MKHGVKAAPPGKGAVAVLLFSRPTVCDTDCSPLAPVPGIPGKHTQVGLPLPPPGDLPHPLSLSLEGGFFTEPDHRPVN